MNQNYLGMTTLNQKDQTQTAPFGQSTVLPRRPHYVKNYQALQNSHLSLSYLSFILLQSITNMKTALIGC